MGAPSGAAAPSCRDGTPLVDATTPAGTAYVAVTPGAMTSGGFVDVDDIRLAY